MVILGPFPSNLLHPGALKCESWDACTKETARAMATTVIGFEFQVGITAKDHSALALSRAIGISHMNLSLQFPSRAEAECISARAAAFTFLHKGHSRMPISPHSSAPIWTFEFRQVRTVCLIRMMELFSSKNYLNRSIADRTATEPRRTVRPAGAFSKQRYFDFIFHQ
jgi:hypothetical protein